MDGLPLKFTLYLKLDHCIDLIEYLNKDKRFMDLSFELDNELDKHINKFR